MNSFTAVEFTDVCVLFVATNIIATKIAAATAIIAALGPAVMAIVLRTSEDVS